MLVDPPSGWQFGFPKSIPKDVKNLHSWLVEQGYPQRLIDEFGEHFWVRFIAEDDDDIK